MSSFQQILPSVLVWGFEAENLRFEVKILGFDALNLGFQT